MCQYEYVLVLHKVQESILLAMYSASTTGASTGFASLPSLSTNVDNGYNDCYGDGTSNDNTADLPDPDEYFVLFPEEDEDNNYCYSGTSCYDDLPDVAKTKTHPSTSKSPTPEDEEYILGTIIVRVVAARGLNNPNHRDSASGVGFAGVFRSPSASATNPYASIKFGRTTQRTSDVYSTLDPAWPRDEVFFMDVSLPASQLTHEPTQLSDEVAATSAGAGSGRGRGTVQDAPELLQDPFHGYKKPDNTTLTVAIFHSELENNLGKNKLHNEGCLSGDSDDTFLGMASVDLTALFTGKVSEMDEWVPLNGTTSDTNSGRNLDYHSSKRQASRGASASVRIVCEYELADVSPRPGDICRFLKICHPKDLYPLEPSRSYKVDQVHNNGAVVILSYESQEGWLLSFQAHRNMLICEERCVSTLNKAQVELQTLGERLSASPLIAAVTETAGKVVDDGLVGIAEGIVEGSAFVFDRWFKGGVGTIIQDLQDITNIDGRHSQVVNIGQSLDVESPASSTCSLVGENNEGTDESMTPYAYQEKEAEGEALPNMPQCPITGFPMLDPVVAADGHTYERSAIARWLKTSEKSPMTGSVLFHKELVPNYGLLSSIEEAAAREEKDSKSYYATNVPADSKDERKAPPDADNYA